MWPGKRNPPEQPETLSERDSDRLRRLSAEVNDLTADFETILGHVERINARLRQRAKRAGADTGADQSGPGDDSDRSNDSDVGRVTRIPPLEEARRGEEQVMTRLQVMERLKKRRLGT